MWLVLLTLTTVKPYFCNLVLVRAASPLMAVLLRISSLALALAGRSAGLIAGAGLVAIISDDSLILLSVVGLTIVSRLATLKEPH